MESVDLCCAEVKTLTISMAVDVIGNATDINFEVAWVVPDKGDAVCHKGFVAVIKQQ